MKAQAALEALERDPSPAAVPNVWRGRIIAGAFIGVWVLGLTLAARYYMRGRTLPENRRAKIGDTVLMRDPVTGDMRRLKVLSTAQKQHPVAAKVSEEDAPRGARVLKETTWIEEPGVHSPPQVQTKRTVLPPPGGE